MTNITIPPEALEAMRAKLPPFFSEGMARAACLAMIRAWPGASGELSDKGNPYIILPLPTEKQND